MSNKNLNKNLNKNSGEKILHLYSYSTECCSQDLGSPLSKTRKKQKNNFPVKKNMIALLKS